jgi:hypothetical protein
MDEYNKGYFVVENGMDYGMYEEERKKSVIEA